MMDARSESYLALVHPDLAKVIRTAAQDPQPFAVVYGLRTLAAEQQAVATGHSTTMHSRHLASTTPAYAGLACAVDVAALIGGNIDFAKGHEQAVFGQITAQIKRAASSLLIAIECGIDWTTFKDYGHVQLPWHQYP